jgi:hypothetical protein
MTTDDVSLLTFSYTLTDKNINNKKIVLCNMKIYGLQCWQNVNNSVLVFSVKV